MKKHFFLLSLLLSLTLGIGQMWGADVINNAATSAKCSGTATNSWVTDFSLTGASGAEYRIHTMGTKNTSNALQWNTNGFMNQTTSGGTLKSVTINGTSGKSVKIFAANSAYSTSKPSGTALATLNLTGSNATYTFTSNYTYLALVGGASSTQIVSITIEYQSGGSDPVSVTGVTLDEDAISLEVDETQTLTATIAPENATNQNVSWTSSNTNVATVSNGTVTAKGVGNANITVTTEDGSFSDVCAVTVTEAKPKITITQDEIASFTNTYAEYTWTAGGVSGKLYAYKNSGMQFNSSKAGYYVYNTDPIPGKIRKITMTKASSATTRTWTPYVSTSAMTSTSGGTALTAKEVASTTTWDVTGDNSYFYLTVAGGSTVISSIVISYEVDASKPAVPTFSLASGSYLGTQSVTISCETSDASIYYTLDGTDPSSSSTHYNGAISISETKTLKAIAIKGDKSSNIATATYTIEVPYTTLAEIFSAATSTETTKHITFGGWKISATASNQAFLTDGTNGLIIYNSSHGFAVGDVLTGTVSCKLVLYKGAAELKELTSSTTGLTVTSGTMSDPVVKTINNLSGVNTGALVTVQDVTFDGTNLSDGTNTIKPHTTLYSASLANGKTYNITGIYMQFDDTKEILPRSANDIEEVVPATLLAPQFSPAAGSYEGTQAVTITSTEGATIYYTTDGSEPTTNSSVYSSPISVSSSQTIKAFAAKEGFTDTEIASAEYTITAGPDVTLDFTDNTSWGFPTSNTLDEMSFTNGDYTVKLKGAGSGNGYKFATNKIIIGKSGAYIVLPKFTTSIKKIVCPGVSGASASVKWNVYDDATPVSTEVTGGASDATFEINPQEADKQYTIRITNAYNLQLTKIKIYYAAPPAVATPTFSVKGGEYTEAQSVTISCTTEGASIYFTTDGSTPSSSSTPYTGGTISIDETTTLKAIAIKGEEESAVASATYTINLPEDEETSKTWDLSIVSCDANPTDNLMEWTATYVKMSIAKGSGTNVTNYYPGTSDKSYTSTRFYNGNTLTFTPNGKQITTIAFTATSSTYATALANSTWTNGSAVASESNVVVTANGSGAVSAAITGTCGFTGVRVDYTTIDESIPANPTFSPAAGTYTSAQSVEISCETEDATIYYTTDGSTPDNTKTAYTTAISVEETTTIKAIAIKDSKSSSVVSATYTINIPELPEGCDGADDFSTATSTSASSYDVERTTTNGWTSVNAALTTISEEACWLTINGKTSAVGVITSPTLNNGISSLKVRYANTFTETKGVSIKVEIKQGETTAKEYTITKANEDVTKGTIYTETIENINVAGDFQIVITNLCPTNSTSNKDRVSIGKLCWTNYEEPAQIYTVTYELNGGEGTAPTQNAVEEGAGITLAGVNGITAPENKEFDGWLCDIDQVKYEAGAQYTMTAANTTFTAQWKDATVQPLEWEEVRTGLTAGNYYTICYPKAMTAIRGGLLFSLGGLETNSVYMVQKDAPFVAGRPYILYATADKLEAVVEGDDAAAGSYNGLYGTLSDMNAAALSAAGATYMLYNNSIRAIGTNNSLKAGRAYIKLTEIPGGAPSGQAPGRVRSIPMQENVATDVEAVTSDGESVTGACKMMIDGKLFILRGEKLYDTTGRMVK